MAYGSSFGISPASSFFQKRGLYESGSMYKRFRLTNSQKLNRLSVRNYDAQIASVGTAIFGQTISQSEQLSVLAVQQMQQRIVDSAQSSRKSFFDLLA